MQVQVARRERIPVAHITGALHVALPVVAVSVLFTAFPLPADAADILPKWKMNHSDVVFMYSPKTPDLYDAYGASIVLWGAADAASVAGEHGVHSQGNFWFLTAWGDKLADDPELLKSVCVDIEGKPIEVPWLTDWKQKLPNYWGCTNAPYYRKYVTQQALVAVQGPVRGVQIDDHCGTARCAHDAGGCFCEHCLASFRAYLEDHYSPQELAALGVTNPETFDYGTYVRRFATTRKQYIERQQSIPLFIPFMNFQARAESALVGEIRAACEKAAGRTLSVSANCGLPAPLHLADYKHLDTLCGEIELRAADGKPSDTAHFAYKVADAVRRPLASTGSGWDWAWIAERNKPGLVKTWVAESYAFGHRLMAPHHQWAYTPEKGTHWWDCRTDDFAPLYRFVAMHRQLFDGFENVSNVVLVYNSPAAYRGHDRSAEAAAYLAAANTQYRVAIAGGDWVDERLTTETLSAAQHVILASRDLPDTQHAAVIEALRKSGNVIDWDGPASCEGKLPRSIRVEGAPNLWVVMRRNPTSGAVAVHLLNRDYALDQDTVRTTGPLTVTIDGALLAGQSFDTASFYNVPHDEPVPVDIRSDHGRTVISVTALDLWGIVLLQGK